METKYRGSRHRFYHPTHDIRRNRADRAAQMGARIAKQQRGFRPSLNGRFDGCHYGEAYQSWARPLWYVLHVVVPGGVMPRRTVANRVFVGYPWKGYRALWEATVRELHRNYPLHFLALGREPGQPAEQLLNKIIHAIDTSSQLIFDATTGNPNVSLEYGYARAVADTPSVFLFLDEDSGSGSGPGRPIIADLAGSIANHYKTSDNSLATTLDAIADRHPYVKLFRRVCRQRGYRGGTQKFILRIIRKLDGEDSLLRRNLVDDLAHDMGKAPGVIEEMLRTLHRAGLITITRGGEYGSRVTIAG